MPFQGPEGQGPFDDMQDCKEQMEGDVDDPDGWCAWAHHETTGEWPSEKLDTLVRAKMQYDVDTKVIPQDVFPEGVEFENVRRTGNKVWIPHPQKDTEFVDWIATMYMHEGMVPDESMKSLSVEDRMDITQVFKDITTTGDPDIGNQEEERILAELQRRTRLSGSAAKRMVEWWTSKIEEGVFA